MRARTAVIIPAAGSGTRMKVYLPKQFLELAGKPLLVYSVSAFAQCDFIDQVVVAVNEDRLDFTRQIIAQHVTRS